MAGPLARRMGIRVRTRNSRKSRGVCGSRVGEGADEEGVDEEDVEVEVEEDEEGTEEEEGDVGDVDDEGKMGDTRADTSAISERTSVETPT